MRGKEMKTKGRIGVLKVCFLAVVAVFLLANSAGAALYDYHGTIFYDDDGHWFEGYENSPFSGQYNDDGSFFTFNIPNFITYDSSTDDGFEYTSGRGVVHIFEFDSKIEGYNGAVFHIPLNSPAGNFNAKHYVDANNFSQFTTTVDISPVPVPAAVWLLGSGLLGLAGIRRKFKTI
jgi:hypothetical protein